MAVIRSSDQISIVDVTDAYSVTLTSEAYTFPGTTNAAKAGSTTTQIIAMCGSEIRTATVQVNSITKPSGVSVTSDNKAPSPTLTISVTTAVATGGVVKIPVLVDGITINKEFSFAIAYSGNDGNGISTTTVSYVTSSSGSSIPSSGWSTTFPTSITPGQYLWTRTTIEYTNGGTPSNTYTVSRIGSDGKKGDDGTGITSTIVEYQAASNGTTTPSGTWSTAIPTVAEGEFLWTRTTYNYSSGSPTYAYSVSKIGEKGADGDPGADAITMTIDSSDGMIFKNSAIATTLTARIFKGGVEITSDTEIEKLGTIKWYKDGGTTAVATGRTLQVSAGQVNHKATYTAQLEG